MTETVTVTDLDPLIAKLERIEHIGNALKVPLVQSAEDVRAAMAHYPPKTQANSPDNPRHRWYERGYGPKWVTKKGGVHGRKTSEKLNRSWSVKYRTTQSEASATIGSRASYVRYVHDRDEQAKVHQWHGWQTAQGTLAIQEPKIIRRLEAAIDAELAK